MKYCVVSFFQNSVSFSKTEVLQKPLVLMTLAIMNIFISCNTSQYTDIQAFLPDLSNKSDGTYRGEQDFPGTPIHVIADVVVQDRAITAINIVKHSCSPIGKKAEVITGQIIERQSLDIDVVSGATVSGKAILKAVENALQ